MPIVYVYVALFIIFVAMLAAIVAYRKWAFGENARRVQLEEDIETFLTELSKRAADVLCPLAQERALTWATSPTKANDPRVFFPGKKLRITDTIYREKNPTGLVAELSFQWAPGQQQRIHIRIFAFDNIYGQSYPIPAFDVAIEEARKAIIGYRASIPGTRDRTETRIS